MEPRDIWWGVRVLRKTTGTPLKEAKHWAESIH